MDSPLLAELRVPDGIAEVDRLLYGGVDFKADGGQALADALQYYPSVVDAYISTGDFKEYIKSGNRVRKLAEALYGHVRRTGDTAKDICVAAFVKMIRYDNRDKKHSVAYLKAFRQAVMDNEYDLAARSNGEARRIKQGFVLLAEDGLVFDAVCLDFRVE